MNVWMTCYIVASKPFEVSAFIIIIVLVFFYCIVLYCIVLFLVVGVSVWDDVW